MQIRHALLEEIDLKVRIDLVDRHGAALFAVSEPLCLKPHAGDLVIQSRGAEISV